MIKRKNYVMKKTFLKSEAEERLKNLLNVKRILDSNLSQYPAGKIRIAVNGNRVQYYLRETSAQNTGTYISKREKRTIATYLQKSYDEKVLRFVEMEIKELERFLRRYGNPSEEIQMVHSHFPQEARLLLKPIDISDEEYASQWQNAPFEPKEIFNMSAQYITDRGEQVRSKSELNIANTLNKLKIPYKYECPLEVRKGLCFYPDFTVLNVRKRKVYYWEHRGMMDDREYAKHAVSRIKEYESNGIIIGKNLIISEETSSTPLGSNDIIRLIDAYLLS